MGRFWFGFVQMEIGIISYRFIFLPFLLTCCVNLINEGWSDVKYREITCILNLTKGRTKNVIDLPPNLRLIDVRIISLSNHASCYLYCCLGASAFIFTDNAAFTLLAFFDIEIIQMIDTECKIIHSADLVFR